MGIRALDHVNIRTADPARTIAFFRDVLEMRAVPAPGTDSIEHGAWILDEREAAVVHVGKLDAAYPSDAAMPFTPAHGGGAIHHIAFNCSGFEEVRDRLERRSINWIENHIPQIALSQIFVREATDIMLELNFYRG